MNPNNQQPYYNYHQHTPGPSQPQWQAPPRQGWGDPRVGSPSPVASSPAVPLPPPPPSQGFGARPGQLPPPPPLPVGGFPAAPHQDTSSWGVKYNQGQQFPPQSDDTPRPTLPPRPTSGQNASGFQSQSQPAWSGQSAISKPPTPPPRPAEYAVPQQQSQSFYYPHEQYSDRPSSHQYDPGNQWIPHPSRPSHTPSVPVPAPAPAWQNIPTKHDDPVSPIDHHPTWQVPSAATRPSALGASALGSGGPSDWEHFSGETTRMDSTSPVQHQQQYPHPPQSLPSQPQPPPQQQQHHAFPANSQSPGPPPPSLLQQQQQLQHGRQQSQPFTVTPEQTHVVPTHTGPERPTYGTSTSPQQVYNSAPHEQATPPASYRHSIATPYQDLPKDDHSNKQRLGSDASSKPSTGLGRSGTIDSVINAWNSPGTGAKVEPLKSSSRPTSTLPAQFQQPREFASIQTQTDFPPVVKTETKVVTKIETQEIDPYEDLKDEYRTSLNRYATMLRQEKAAQSEQEKMRIVSEFVNREVKLRSVMFNAEPAELIRSKELAELRQAAERVKVEKAMVIPPAPTVADQHIDRSQSLTERKPRVETNVAKSQHSRDDSFVIIGADGDDTEYSPTGRPRVPMVNRIPAQQRPHTPAVSVEPPRKVNQAVTQPRSPGADAPMTLDDYAMPDHPSIGPDRSFNATPAQIPRPDSAAPPNPMTPATPANAPPIPFQPARPAYAPFRYSEAQSQPQPLVNQFNPADMAYTKLRNEQAAESGRLLSQEPPLLTVTGPDRSQSATPSRARQQQEEAFIGLLRQQSRARQKPARIASSDAPAPLRAGTPLQRRPSLPPLVKSTETLRQSLPESLTQLNFVNKVHPKLGSISQSMSKVSDDFGFIHGTVVGWDRENRKVRQRLDAERATRESESQEHMDSLFHDNQIGYADIGRLEEDFKLDEANKKYQEDQDELDSFTRNVFEKVASRLEMEIAELETTRIRALDVLDLETISVSQRIQTAMRNSSAALEKAPIADTMAIMLQIFDKIEVRQQKIAEANFERERRRKRLELTVLYTNGDTPGIKQLEKDFDKAQALQVLSEARKRDERANKLMDSFDRAVVRGLAENQEWIDETSNKAVLVRDLVLGSASNGLQGQEREDLLYGSRGVRESIDLLQEAVGMVLSDSRQLVQMSSQADHLLNEADFAMFLAEAKIANADDKEFDKLKSEKIKEDQKLKDESEGRMNGIRRGPDEITGVIKDVKDYIGNDKGHQERINQALEAAKKRNQSPPGQDSGIGSMREV